MFLGNELCILLSHLHYVTKSYHFLRGKYDLFFFCLLINHFNKENIAIMKGKLLRILQKPHFIL